MYAVQFYVHTSTSSWSETSKDGHVEDKKFVPCIYIYVHVHIEMLLRYYSIEHAYVQYIQTVQDRYQYIKCVRS